MEPFFGNFDLAQLTLYLFWVFFACLVIYLQRENMREGYPLVNDDGEKASNEGPFGVPMAKKTFKLPHGRGEVTVPDDRIETREIKVERTMMAEGYPFAPTGDALEDGVGPASWAARQDWPELDGHGHVKIVPMSTAEGFAHAAGRDPRGMPVIGRDGATNGTISDIWVDKPEQEVRYLEIDLGGDGKRLVPMTMAQVTGAGVRINSLPASYFNRVPTTKKPAEVTLLEEEKIMAFYAGGRMYAH